MRLTRRQAAGLIVAAGLGAVVVVAALLDRTAIALAALGIAGVLLFLGLLQARRRITGVQAANQALARDLRATTAQVAVLRREVATAARKHEQAALARHRELLATVQSEQRQAARRLGTSLTRRQRDQTREVEALLQLFHKVEPVAPMPSSGHWALNPTELLELWSVIERTRPRLVLELGSGTSSVWIGYALQRWHGRLVSVEHEPGYAGYSRAQLERHGLAGTAEVRDAPLQPVAVDGEVYTWYNPATLSDLDRIDLLVVDGPPGPTGPRARYPALPLLAERLSDPATVILDDVDRADEQAILAAWTQATEGLSRERVTVGHLAVLSYTRTGRTISGGSPG